MPYNPQKALELENARQQSRSVHNALQRYSDKKGEFLKTERGKKWQKNEEEKARKTLNKYSTGKNKGLSKSVIGNAKSLVKNLSPVGLFSLMLQVSPTRDWTYGLAFLAATLKDILDLVQVTGIFYVAIVALTFCCSIWIGFMMLLASFGGDRGSRVQRKIVRSWLVLLTGTAAELLFGINFLPIETLTVLIVYGLALMERKQS